MHDLETDGGGLSGSGAGSGPGSGAGMLRSRMRPRSPAGRVPYWAIAILALQLTGGAVAIATGAGTDMDVANAWCSPSAIRWLGCDQLGRDLFFRLLAAAPVSIALALAAVGGGTTAGGLIGLAAGLSKGWSAEVLAGAIDALCAFPRLLLALLASSFAGGLLIGAETAATILALGGMVVPGMAMVARLEARDALGRSYVRSSISLGAGNWHLMTNHVGPAVTASLVTRAVSSVSGVIAAEAALGFVGMGLPDDIPGWGSIMRHGLAAADSWPVASIAASVMLTATVASLSALADTLLGRRLR